MLSILMIGISGHSKQEPDTPAGYESFQDPNLIKNAPRSQSREPSSFDNDTVNKGQTEGDFCYGLDCEKDKKKVKKQNIFDLFM